MIFDLGFFSHRPGEAAAAAGELEPVPAADVGAGRARAGGLGLAHLPHPLLFARQGPRLLAHVPRAKCKPPSAYAEWGLCFRSLL